MKSAENRLLTLISFFYIFAVFYLGLFLHEFFPMKSKHSPKVCNPPKYIDSFSLNVEKNYKPQTDRIIFIIIDGLRMDFFNQYDMPYVYQSATGYEGCHIKMEAELPTVTMPRIKAMTTGSVPQFIDVILNFASQKVTEDSWLQRAKEAGKGIVFFGDNTWLKLYPNMFLRSDGTTSFYVNDYKEVDNNVTRHLDTELKNNDWDIMILHYLGLDHIGHVFGPFNSLIKTKLFEMDNIIQKIHEVTKIDNKTMIIITGDHGMRDLGGHGGSTEAEVMIPFIVLNKPCSTHRKIPVMQTDLAPTLASLMGLPLPADSVGKIIYDLPYKTKLQNLYLLHYNALNLIKIDSKFHAEFVDIFDKHLKYLKNEIENHWDIIDAYENKIHDISRDLVKSSVNQHVPFLHLSFSNLALIWMILMMSAEVQSDWLKLCFLGFGIVSVLFYFKDNYLSLPIVYADCLIMLCIFLYIVPSLLLNVAKKFTTSKISVFLLFGTFLRTLLLLSTSYIEFEEQIWYFLWGGFCVLGANEEIKKSKDSWTNVYLWIGLFIGLRISRSVSYMAQWDFIPGIIHQFGINILWRWPTFLTGLVGIIYFCCNVPRTSKYSKLVTILTIFAIFCYRITLLHDKHSVYPARMAVFLMSLSGFINYIKQRNILKTVTLIWILYMALLMKPYNVILIPMCLAGSRILFKLCCSTGTLILSHMWLEEILFFSQGFENSLSSVDISVGYVGLTQYSVIVTTFQVICHTYAFRILPLLLLLDGCKFRQRISVLHTFIIYRLFSVIFYCFVMLIHRQHLFIWSVFSPKLLIESCHCLFLLLVVSKYLLANKLYGRKYAINIQ